MKELYRSSDTALIGFYQSILDEAGIPHLVRNESTQQAVVGGLVAAILHLPDFWPALCVVSVASTKESQYGKAPESR